MLRRAIWMLLGICAAGNLFSQNLTRSPYSGFGAGDLQFFGFAQQQAMGRLGQSYRNRADYSIANPASYSALQYTVYQAGLNASVGTLKNNTTTQNASTASLGYFSLGVPLDTLGWGAVFGLTPYSAVGHNSYYSTNDTLTGNYQTLREGSGGLNRFYLGMGRRLFSGLSVGVNASYIFGQLTSTDKVYFHPDSSYVDYREDRTRFVNGFNFDAGLQYSGLVYRDTVKDVRWQMNVGGTYHFGSNLNARQQLYARTVYQFQGNDLRRDTTLFTESENGSLHIPQGYSVGLGFERQRRRDRLFLGIEYFTQNWKNYTSFGQGEGLSNLQSFSAGMSYQPELPSENTDITRKYYNFIQYRAGFRYSNTHVTIANTQITEYGINFGLSFPVKPFRHISYLHLAVEYNSRGTVKNNLIQENYYRFVLGFTLTDKWFKKYKYE